MHESLLFLPSVHSWHKELSCAQFRVYKNQYGAWLGPSKSMHFAFSRPVAVDWDFHNFCLPVKLAKLKEFQLLKFIFDWLTFHWIWSFLKTHVEKNLILFINLSGIAEEWRVVSICNSKMHENWKLENDNFFTVDWINQKVLKFG